MDFVICYLHVKNGEVGSFPEPLRCMKKVSTTQQFMLSELYLILLTFAPCFLYIILFIPIILCLSHDFGISYYLTASKHIFCSMLCFTVSDEFQYPIMSKHWHMAVLKSIKI